MRAIAFGFQLASLVVSATGEASLCFLLLTLALGLHSGFVAGGLHGFFNRFYHEILQRLSA